MIKRTWYTLSMAYKHREKLKTYRYQPALQRASILECDPVLLKDQGIKAVILDVDGVLVPYGEIQLSQKIDSWLKICIQILGEGKVFILTNQPTLIRKDYFLKNYKGIKFLLPGRKKPYPDGITQVLQANQIAPSELLIIDDRLLTGILAAVIAQASGCYITKPLRDFAKRPIQELFFNLLRKIERFIV